MADYIRYRNQGATRRLPLSPRLQAALAFLPELGVTAEVFSGGQPAKGSGLPRVGSVRHDHGDAGDVFFYRGNQRLDWANPQDRPIFEQIVAKGKNSGITGFGAGPGYMQPGSMHLGFGSPGVWGAGGSGATAPDWLRKAYGGSPAGPAPAGGNSIMSPTSVASWSGAPTPAGEVTSAVPTQAVASVPYTDLQSAALAFMQNRAAKEEAKAAEEEAEATRKAALFGNLGALFG